MRTLLVVLQFPNMPRQDTPDEVLCQNLEDAISDGPDALYALMERPFTVAAKFNDVADTTTTTAKDFARLVVRTKQLWETHSYPPLARYKLAWIIDAEKACSELSMPAEWALPAALLCVAGYSDLNVWLQRVEGKDDTNPDKE